MRAPALYGRCPQGSAQHRGALRRHQIKASFGALNASDHAIKPHRLLGKLPVDVSELRLDMTQPTAQLGKFIAGCRAMRTRQRRRRVGKEGVSTCKYRWV